MWDRRARNQHWIQKEWPIHKTLTVGMQNIVNEPIVSRNKIVFPPLHLKLGFMKQFAKALKTDSDCFQYIVKSLPGLSIEKKKAGVFNGPQIRYLIKDKEFIKTMNIKEKMPWLSFVVVVKNFLGNKKAENYADLVDEMLEAFCDLGCKKSIKLHYINSHLDQFPENLGDVSEEQGERFHQDLKTIEDCYQGRWDIHMMADYCWGIK